MNDVTKRFIEAYKNLGLTGYRMGKESKVITKQKISNIENGLTDVSSDILADFLRLYGDKVDANYILTGVQSDNIRPVSPYLREDLVQLDYISISAMASFVETLYGGSVDIEKYGVISEEGEVLDASTDIIFQVDGDSMTPTIPNGSKILARKIEECKWEVLSGVVVIVYGKALTVKRILKNALYCDNKLTLKADNPLYGQMDVERSEIRGIWQALRIVSQKII